MIRKEREIKVIYVLVLAIFAVFLAVPIVRLLLESFLGEAGAGISNYVEVLTGQGFLQALGNSVAVSISSALISTVLAFFMAYSIQYTNLPGKFKTVIRTLAVLPMLLPTITYGFAIIYSFGKQGLLTRLFGSVQSHGRQADPDLLADDHPSPAGNTGSVHGAVLLPLLYRLRHSGFCRRRIRSGGYRSL